MWLNTYFPNIVYLIRAEYKKWELEKINYTLKKILTKRLNFTLNSLLPAHNQHKVMGHMGCG